MTPLLQVVKTLEKEVANKPHEGNPNAQGGKPYLPAFFEHYVLKDILGKYHDDTDRFESVGRFSKFMDLYANNIYQPDCTAYAWEYSFAAKNVKNAVLARFNT